MSIRLRYLDRDGAEREEVKRGLTAGTFQHELDHLDGTLFVDQVTDLRTLTTWAQFERFHRRSLRRSRARARGAGRLVASYWCTLAWLGGSRPEAGVVIDVEDGRIAAVSREQVPPRDARRLDGLTCRASPTPIRTPSSAPCAAAPSAGAAHSGRGGSRCTRWPSGSTPTATWPLRARPTPRWRWPASRPSEFHYVHHGPGGTPYDDPNEMGRALIAAASDAGIRLTLIDCCYLHGGIGDAAEKAQRRFSDGSAEAWVKRVDELAERVGADRGRDPQHARGGPGAAAIVAGWVAERRRPLHAHVSEQPAENEACLAAYGRTPTALLADAGALAANFTAVHATHLDDADVDLLGGAGACCRVCPTTERDLADGIGRMRRLSDAGASLSLGSDSHAVIDLFEEARAVELDERLATGERGHHDAGSTAGGLGGRPRLPRLAGRGRIEPGARADLVTVWLGGVQLAGTSPELALDAVVFAGAARDVRHVLVGGHELVVDGRHASIDVAGELHEAALRVTT